ncbi:hypothetical protein Hanom_Chr09g00852131 [Helianthus anomalus]
MWMVEMMAVVDVNGGDQLVYGLVVAWLLAMFCFSGSILFPFSWL